MRLRTNSSGQRDSRAVTLTPTGKAQLEELADQMGLSKSELVEQIARRMIFLYPNTLPAEVKEGLKKPYSRLFFTIVKNWLEKGSFKGVQPKATAALV